MQRRENLNPKSIFWKKHSFANYNCGKINQHFEKGIVQMLEMLEISHKLTKLVQKSSTTTTQFWLRQPT